MNPAIPFPAFRFRLRPWLALQLALYAVIACFLASHYLQVRSPLFLCGMAAMAGVTTCNLQHTRSLRYAYAVLLLSLLTLLLPVKTLLYALLACAFLFTLETTRGRTDGLPLLLTGLLSPACQYLSDLFTFPLRLQLSQWAGKILALGSAAAKTEGNVIYFNGDEFSVDPACVGLHMMITSLVTGVLLIAVFKRRLGKAVPLWMSVCMLALFVLLNLASNLFRILLLVHFGFGPDTFLHQLTGILCFAVYVMLPGALLCRWLIQRRAQPAAGSVEQGKTPAGVHPVWHAVVTSCLLAAAVQVYAKETQKAVPLKTPPVAGYTTHGVDAEITKLENGRSLVYLKKIAGCWAAEHNPMICWRGSGYGFSRIREVSVAGTTVYEGVLTKEHEQLHTIWWYTNGIQDTNRQLGWRWDMMKGAPAYSLVNITCLTEQQVQQEAERVLRLKPFGQLMR